MSVEGLIRGPDKDSYAYCVAVACRDVLNERYEMWKQTAPADSPLANGSQFVNKIADSDWFRFFGIAMSESEFPLLQCVWVSGYHTRVYSVGFTFPASLAIERQVGGIVSFAADGIYEALQLLDDQDTLSITPGSFSTTLTMVALQDVFYPLLTVDFEANFRG